MAIPVPEGGPVLAVGAGATSGWAARLRRFLPHGRGLPDEEWALRHRILVWVVLLHAVGLAAFGLARGWHPAWALGETAAIAALGALAMVPLLGRRFRSTLAALALVTSSAVLVQFWGGYIEGHFHYFVAVALASLYQEWLAFLVAVSYVAVNHGLIGTLAPAWVYNHTEAIAQPWSWAGVHAIFVLAECVALVVVWRASEQSRMREMAEHGHRVRQETELHRLQEENRFKTVFINSAAHELRTPLMALKLHLHTLRQGKRGPLNDEQARLAETLGRNVDRLSRLVEDVLDVGRIQGGVVRLERAPVDLSTLVREATEAHAALARDRGVHLEVAGDAGVHVEADPRRLHQVVANLVDNAVKFTPAGGRVDVRAFLREGQAVVEVADTGAGLDGREAHRLFQPFQQLEAGVAAGGGTGLGLYISKSLAEAHGGTLTAASAGPGHGATFTLTLPEATAVKAVALAVHA